jgi:hypothetical protein
MYRASAPFFEGDKGDRRVTGWQFGFCEPSVVVLSRLNAGERWRLENERRRFVVEFSREFGGLPVANQW